MLDLIRSRIEKQIMFSRQKLLSRNHSGGLVRVAHSLLLTSTGRVLSFGTGQYGALGHGYSGGKQLPDILRPTYIEGKFSLVNVCRCHQKSLFSNICMNYIHKPIALSGIRCVCIAAGELHSAAVTVDGDLYTW